MNDISFIYLSHKDILNVGITMSQTIDIVEDVFIEHGKGNFENPPKPGVHPKKNSFIHAMPGFLPKQQACAMKWVSGFPDNHHFDLPSIMGLIILNDPETGKPLGMLEGGYITALRTAAVSGVAARYLSIANPEKIAIIGAGVQGRYHVTALKEIFPDIREFRIYDINHQAVESFVAGFDRENRFKVKSADNIQTAMKNADIVVTATGTLAEPIYKTEWVKEGALILPVHMNGWPKSVLTRMDLFFTDDWMQFSTYMKPHNIYEPFLDPDAELGEVVTGKKPGRRKDSQRIINFNLGIALHDIAIAKQIFEQSILKGTGEKLNLI